MLELGQVVVLALVLGVCWGIWHRVKTKCRARDGRRKSGSGRARSRCKARAGCSVKAKAWGNVVQVGDLNTAFCGTPYSLCFLRLAPAKVLVRKSAIRVCSGASTLKDQNLGQVPGWRERNQKKSGSCHINKNIFRPNYWSGARGMNKSAIYRLAETARNCRREKGGRVEVRGVGACAGASKGQGAKGQGEGKVFV